MKKYEINMKTNFLETVSEVETIPGVIERVMLNLVQNAANALVDHPSKNITISIYPETDYEVLVIQDTGPGIPEERIKSMWQKFGYSETATKASSGKRSGGSGFGLYKVKQMVEDIHGELSVETSPFGTTFKIKLPKKYHASEIKKNRSAIRVA